MKFADPSDLTSPTQEFKQDLRDLLEEYDEVDDKELRRTAYQVIDYYGEENVARKIRDGEIDSVNEENEP